MARWQTWSIIIKPADIARLTCPGSIRWLKACDEGLNLLRNTFYVLWRGSVSQFWRKASLNHLTGGESDRSQPNHAHITGLSAVNSKSVLSENFLRSTHTCIEVFFLCLITRHWGITAAECCEETISAQSQNPLKHASGKWEIRGIVRLNSLWVCSGTLK